MRNDWVFDVETYPNVFTIAFEHCEAPIKVSYEISNYKNESLEILAFLSYIRDKFGRLIGFNNVGFDYPVIHLLMKMGRADAPTLYNKAMAIINAGDREKYTHFVKPSDRYIPQVDLFKIHHFDNKARATSLKVLEFNMRSLSIQDLPFPVGTTLDRAQIDLLRKYNAHDVTMTKKFYHESKGMITFREELSDKYHRDFVNHNDTKIGKDFFVMQLEEAGVSCYEFGKDGRQPKQTPRRDGLRLVEAVLPWIQFERSELNRVLEWMKQQTIYGTKDVLKERIDYLDKHGEEAVKWIPLVAKVDGFEFVFGTGGIHGSLSSEIVESDEEHMILDLDVTSYYPNLAIKNGFYPEHLGQTFVHIYQSLFEQRKAYPKKSAESAMLKLALNGVYGDSGNQFSVFYDPLFTMKITLNGQLLLCMLAEQLMKIPAMRMLQINTDGLTVKIPRNQEPLLRQICEWWQQATQLNLEDVEYKSIHIRDVNNYIAVSMDGKVKRKGAYEWQAGGWYDSGYNGWNQDASFLVVPKVAERVLVSGHSIRETVENWPHLMDFMIRIKVPRSSQLFWGDEQVQNTSRYLVTTEGKPLTKVMPPLAKKPGEWRRFNIESGWKVTMANELTEFDLGCDPAWHMIDYNYYIQEVEKLVMVLK